MELAFHHQTESTFLQQRAINLLSNKWKWGHIIVPEKSSIETDHFLASPMQHNAQSLHFYPCGSAQQPSHRLQLNVLFDQKARLAEVKVNPTEPQYVVQNVQV